MGQMWHMPANRTLPAQQSALVNQREQSPLRTPLDLKLAGGGDYPKASDRSERSEVQESCSSNKVLLYFLDYLASGILTFAKKKAADIVEGGAHGKRIEHVGDNDRGVNVLYGSEQNFRNGNIGFGSVSLYQSDIATSEN